MASHLLDLYREKAYRLAELEEQGELPDADLKEYHALNQLFDEAAEQEAVTLLGMVFGSDTESTGDKVIDEWNEALDRGEIPEEFWGPMGRPDGVTSE